jgi:transcriptional regulator with XRE-family HTH domain
MRALPVASSAGKVRIGARLRAARRRQNLTIEQLAESTGLNKGFISRVERDETSPSVATLLTLCEVIHLPVGSLFETPETELVKADEAPLINLGGTGAEERLLTPRGQSRLQLIRSHIGPGGSGGADMYTLNSEIEVVHVLSGVIEVAFVDGAVRVEAGDALTFSGREPHTWVNPDPGHPAEVLWVLVPAPWSGSE